ncbi:hypothetical protein AVEN_188463-1 [Araneus ventricosus]|uniref:Uncharacterized protein n=1 Tax=Araneus ventricosus TaxID=182803 RepID=A0A4Y2U816_ARAVE|nr:hypothetical protein AVEN_188463-1 [Araneus ventricosus]
MMNYLHDEKKHMLSSTLSSQPELLIPKRTHPRSSRPVRSPGDTIQNSFYGQRFRTEFCMRPFSSTAQRELNKMASCSTTSLRLQELAAKGCHNLARLTFSMLKINKIRDCRYIKSKCSGDDERAL